MRRCEGDLVYWWRICGRVWPDLSEFLAPRPGATEPVGQYSKPNAVGRMILE